MPVWKADGKCRSAECASLFVYAVAARMRIVAVFEKTGDQPCWRSSRTDDFVTPQDLFVGRWIIPIVKQTIGNRSILQQSAIAIFRVGGKMVSRDAYKIHWERNPVGRQLKSSLVRASLLDQR
jgi:hypothetical protein